MKYFEIYLFNDQPTTCPKCGNRTDIILDFYDQLYKAQLHLCITKDCRSKFMIEEDL